MDSVSDIIELLDLGDAMIETKQGTPGISYPDSEFGLGRWPGFLEVIGS